MAEKEISPSSGLTPMSQKDLVLLGLVNPLNQLFYGLRLVTLGHEAGDQLEFPFLSLPYHQEKNNRDIEKRQGASEDHSRRQSR